MFLFLFYNLYESGFLKGDFKKLHRKEKLTAAVWSSAVRSTKEVYIVVFIYFLFLGLLSCSFLHEKIVPFEEMM